MALRRGFQRPEEIATGTVRDIAYYGPNVAISGDRCFDSRLSLAPDGKSLATSVETSKS